MVTKERTTTKKAVVKPRIKKAEKVEPVEKEAVTSEIEKKVGREGKYVYAVGRRKSAKAQVKLMETGKGNITVNGKNLKDYFTYFILQETVVAPLKTAQEDNLHDVSVSVLGGGPLGQAEAIRLGIARALIKWNEAFKPVLKKMGFLTRDPRVKERKKFGLKKARRAPQWSKR